MIASRLAGVVIALLIALAATAANAQDAVDGFAPRTFVGAGGVKMPYRLFVPDQKARTLPLPAIVYLHGGAGNGTDNLTQISGGNANGTHVWTTPQMQSRHPAFVIAAQLPPGTRWDDQGSDRLAPHAQVVIELLDSVAKEFSIDRDRVYLTGQSLGGIGTWDVIAKRPDLFAAAIPLCGVGDPARASSVRDMAIWVFHGAKDDAVPVSGSREMVAALRKLGSAVKYTEYPDVEHNVWLRAYLEPQLADWLFAQKRTPKPKPQ